MVSVNLIFHVVSALTFAILIWYLLQVQSQLSFLRVLSDSLTQSQAKVVVDWPEAFLRKFAAAQGIAYLDQGKASHAAQKIDVKLWAELHAKLGIQAIERNERLIRLTVRKNADLPEWGSRLESSLQGKMSVEWKTLTP